MFGSQSTAPAKQWVCETGAEGYLQRSERSEATLLRSSNSTRTDRMQENHDKGLGGLDKTPPTPDFHFAVDRTDAPVVEALFFFRFLTDGHGNRV